MISRKEYLDMVEKMTLTLKEKYKDPSFIPDMSVTPALVNVVLDLVQMLREDSNGLD